MIPKIIHQTAPKNTDNWHPLWKECQPTWKEQFPEPEYTYRMWNDDDIDLYVEENFPEYLEYYHNLPLHIMQIDFFRYALMYKEGGIYADMDLFCYQNFYDELDGTYLLQSMPHAEYEVVSNALMAAPPGNQFFKDCMDFCVQVFSPISFEINYGNFSQNLEYIGNYVLNQTGPSMISKIYYQYNDIKTFDNAYYNRKPHDYVPELKVRNMMTGFWGREFPEYLKIKQTQEKIPGLRNQSFDDYMKSYYHSHRSINLKKFNFHKDMWGSQTM